MAISLSLTFVLKKIFHIKVLVNKYVEKPGIYSEEQSAYRKGTLIVQLIISLFLAWQDLAISPQELQCTRLCFK